MNTKKMVVGILGLGLLAAVAAFAIWQLFAPGTTAVAQSSAGQPEIVMAVSEVVNGESFSGEVRVSFAEAAGLPTTSPAALGLFLERSGDTLTLGTGPIAVEVGVERVNDEEPVTTIQASHDGDEVTVLVTEGTAVYADTTASPHITPEDIAAGHKTINRTIAPGSLDAIGENMIVRVWGAEQNGQFVADVLVYELIK